jgi:hypothetical protein
MVDGSIEVLKEGDANAAAAAIAAKEPDEGVGALRDRGIGDISESLEAEVASERMDSPLTGRDDCIEATLLLLLLPLTTVKPKREVDEGTVADECSRGRC